MLRTVTYILAITALVDAQQARKELCDKVNSLLVKDSTLKPNDMFNLADVLVKDVINNKKLTDIPFKDHCMREVPKPKLPPFNEFKNKMDDCLKKKNSEEKTDKILEQFGQLTMKIIQPNFDRITKKRDNARKNKKSNDELRPIIYNAAKDELTKGIIQKVIDEAMKTFKCPVWQCLVTNAKSLAHVDKYTVSTKNCKA